MNAGETASWRFLEFFTANMPNKKYESCVRSCRLSPTRLGVDPLAARIEALFAADRETFG